MKIRPVIGGGQIFFCPACKDAHAVNLNPDHPRWDYNGDPDKPTFRPSIKVSTCWSKKDTSMTDEICHSFVTDGRIEFCGDCTHALAGQTVEIPEWPYVPGSYGGIDDAA